MKVDHALRLVRHRNPNAFVKSAALLFARNPAAYSGIVASARGIDARAAATSSLLTVHGANGPEGVAIRREQGFVALGDSSAHAADLIARALAADGVRLAGIVGSFEACEAFALAWRARTGNVHTLRFHLRNYALGTLAQPRPAPGFARVAGSDEGELCCRWLADFRDEARVPDDPSRLRAITLERIAGGGVWLWVHGHARALLGFVRPTPRMARIVSVYTPPAERGRGYARSLVANAAAMLREAGCADVYLTADVANPTSNRLYQGLGFVPVGDQYHFDLVPAPARAQ